MSENTELNKIIGHRLLALRNYHRLSQAEMSELIGSGQKYISEWESGKRLVSFKALLKIHQKFKITLGFFDPHEDDYSKHLKDSVLPEKLNNKP